MREACSWCHLAPQVSGALKPTLGKSLRYPPGGDGDELVWLDKCPARQEEPLELEARGGAGEILSPTPLLPHRQLGCPPMACASPRQSFSFSFFLNATAGLLTCCLFSGQEPTSIPFCPILGLSVVHSLSTLLADNSAPLLRALPLS